MPGILAGFLLSSSQIIFRVTLTTENTFKEVFRLVPGC